MVAAQFWVRLENGSDNKTPIYYILTHNEYGRVQRQCSSLYKLIGLLRFLVFVRDLQLSLV